MWVYRSGELISFISGFDIDGRWLLTESLRIGSVVLIGFLLAHFLNEFIAAFGVELLY